MHRTRRVRVHILAYALFMQLEFLFWLFSRNLPYVSSAYTSRRVCTHPSYSVRQLGLNQISCIFCSFILDAMFYYLSLSGFTHFLMSIF